MKNLLLFLALMMSAGVFAQDAANYKVVNMYPLPGDGYWDYLSIDSHGRLFVSHNTIVQVLDSKGGKLLGTIEGLEGVHGIALAEKLHKGFISSGRDSVVAIFDLRSLQILDKVKVTGANPDAIIYDPYSNKVFTFNGRSSNATVIDALTNEVVATIQLDGKPEFPVSDKKGKIYVNIEDKSLISCINTKDLKLEKSWPISPGEEPSGLAADFENGKLFSVCDNNLMIVFDLKTEKVIQSIPIGSRTDGAAFDESLKRAYSSNGDGTMTVVQESGDQFKVLETVKTQAGARTICLDPETHHLFLPTSEFEPLVKGERRPKIKPGTFVVLEVAP